MDRLWEESPGPPRGLPRICKSDDASSSVATAAAPWPLPGILHPRVIDVGAPWSISAPSKKESPRGLLAPRQPPLGRGLGVRGTRGRVGRDAANLAGPTWAPGLVAVSKAPARGCPRRPTAGRVQQNLRSLLDPAKWVGQVLNPRKKTHKNPRRGQLANARGVGRIGPPDPAK